MLNLAEGRILVGIAREAIESHLSGRRPNQPTTTPPRLMDPYGVFVTLLEPESGSLKGCIGNPFPDRPIIQQTALSAVEAASMDPRFSPVRLRELNWLLVEVTVLSTPEQINVKSPLELTNRVEIGRHGLVIEGNGLRGLLLPQVAVDEEFDPEEFLTQCCLKAGMLPDAWLVGNIRVLRFEGQIFSEDKPRGSVSERKLLSPEK